MTDQEQQIRQLVRVVSQQRQLLVRADRAIDRANAIFRSWPLLLIVWYLLGMLCGAGLMRVLLEATP